jgi:hypothetical protein
MGVGDLFGLLQHRVDANARHAVDVYNREVSEYRAMPADGEIQLNVLDFAVFIRRRTIELAAENRPLGEEDLAIVASIGRQRAEQRLSVPSQQHVLGLHTSLMLQEIHDAARPADVDDLLRLVGWFGPQGVRARAAYLQGYTTGVGRSRSVATKVELLTRALLADEPVEPFLAVQLGMRLAETYRVCVVRLPQDRKAAAKERAEVLGALLERRRVPVVWTRPDELVLLAADDEPPEGTVSVLRELAVALGRPCAVGAVTGNAGALGEALVLARKLSRVAPLEKQPRHLYTVADLFVELAVAELPQVDDWLRSFTERLTSGPDLVLTLDTYYRRDMNRVGTAATLKIHPRTLDYRLQRVRELTGIDPGSAHGVRILTVAVARALAGGWN